MMAAKLDQQVEQANEEMRRNAFSSKFDKSAVLIRRGDEGYGKAVKGSKTEERAKQAKVWVDAEIDKLVEIIREHGEEHGAEEQGAPGLSIPFGKLFTVYADISDTLVGILMRAKRRKRVAYESDMLFQGVHDHVLIRVL